jgi:hypothetical protein
MPKLEYFLVSESVSIDRDRNQVSVFNILEEVSIPKSTPAQIPQLVALGSWILEPEDEGRDFQATVEVVLPGTADPEKTTRSSINFTGSKKRQRICNWFLYLPVQQVGEVVFRLLLNGAYQASHTVTVRQSEDGD